MFLIFFLLWMIFNGRITAEIILFGIGVSTLCYGVACALFGLSIQKDLAFAKKLPGILKLLGILLAEIVKANWAVIRMVYARKNPEPEYISFEAPLETQEARTALANCITLTPGTITGVLEGGKYTVHCLDKSMAEGLDKSPFVRQLQKIEEKEQAK